MQFEKKANHNFWTSKKRHAKSELMMYAAMVFVFILGILIFSFI